MNRFNLPLAILALMMTACGDDNMPRTGQLSVQVTDAPVDSAEHVVVRFTGLSFKPAGEPARQVVFDVP